MVKGIKITKKVDIPKAQEKDFVVDTLLAGSLKIHKVLTFYRGGDQTLTNVSLGQAAYIQKYNHELGYVPAYLAYAIYGSTATPSLVSIPYNNFITVAGNSNFINVNPQQVIVGFDTNDPTINSIRVILFAEKLA